MDRRFAINHVPGFVVAQLIGAIIAALASTALFAALKP
jgi:glycerol uptake facilitator-like aquaporin